MEKQFYNFVKEVYDKQLGVEGIAIADGEKILMEHHFTPDQARNIYSHTKSYMSTAVGLAIADGKLSLDDRLAEFFPEAVPENAQPELFEIRLRHLLMMSSGFHEPYLMDGKWKGQQLVDPAWIKEATAKQIETPNPGNDIWVCGYGYQFWRNPYEDSYRADGAYGQLTMVLPKKGLIVAIQCPESGDLNKVKPVMHELILSL